MLRLWDNNTVKARRRLSFPKTVKIKRQYDPENLRHAFDATRTGTSVYRAAQLYGIPESTLRDRTRGIVHVDAKHGGETLFSQEEEQKLVDHIKYMSSIGYGYTKVNVQYLGADYAVSVGKKSSSNKPLSDNWFYGFMKRWPDLKVAKPQKLSLLRAQYASRDKLTSYFRELGSILTVNALKETPARIYNMDETGISTEHAPPRIVCDSGSNPQSVTSPRSSTVTIIGAGNAVGNYIPPYYIFPGKRWNSNFLDGAPPGSAGEMSDSGWSNSEIFQNYLTEHFAKYAGITTDPNSSKTIVLFDGHKSHISLTLVVWAKRHNVILFVLPPHTSHITQPLDVAVFGPFKSLYSRECQQYLQKHPGQKITKYDVARLSCKPYLKSMSPENLTSAFRKSGIYPFSNKTIADSDVAPSTIYSSGHEDNHDKENVPDQPDSPESLTHTARVRSPAQQPSVQQSSQQLSTQFFASRTITTVPKKPKKKFVPPFLVGNLAKQNIDILESINKPKQTCQKKVSSKVSNKKRSALPPSTSAKKKARVAQSSPQPGPSAFWIDDSSDDMASIASDSQEDKSENCCVSGKFSPPVLRTILYLVIVKWAQCDKCNHWTHLSFCSSITFVRTHGEFFCPHC